MTSARSKKRVLFVCTNNQVRSLTAALLYRERPDLEVRSAGTAEHAAVPLTEDLFAWADQVFVFSRLQRKVVKERFGKASGGKTVCLNLPDRFLYKEPRLVIKLTRKLGRHLGRPTNGERTPTLESPAAPPALAATEPPSARSKRAATLLRPALMEMFNRLSLGLRLLLFVVGLILLLSRVSPP